VKVTFESQKLSKQDRAHCKVRFREFSFWSLSTRELSNVTWALLTFSLILVVLRFGGFL